MAFHSRTFLRECLLQPSFQKWAKGDPQVWASLVANMLFRLVPKDIPPALARERLGRVFGRAAAVADEQDPIILLHEWIADAFEGR